MAKDKQEIEFTNNGQIKSALVQIKALKKEIADLKADNDALKQRIKLLEGHLKK